MSDQIHHSGRFLEFVERDGWEFVRRTTGPDVVAIAALTPAGEVVLVEQLRKALGATGRRVIEVPAGLIGDGADGPAADEPLTAGRRELMEEAGFTATEWERVTSGPCAAGCTDETVHFVVARKLQRCGSGGGVDGEEITVHLIPLATIDTWLAGREAEGTLVDPKVWAALHLLQRPRG